MNAWFWIGVYLLVLGLIVAYVVIVNVVERRRHKVSFMEGLDLTGLPIVTLQNNGRKFNFVLDTGSYNSVINERVLENMEYENTHHIVDLMGIDGISHNSQKVIRAELGYKNKSITAQFVVANMDGIFDAVKRETGAQLHGLLGSNFFRENKYIINYDELVAYSKKV